MNLFEIAWQWTVLLLAEVLNASASAVEVVLRCQPRWVAKVRLLEEQLRSSASSQPGDLGTTTAGGGLVAGGGPTEALIKSYAILSQALKDLETRGLALDGVLLERMKREWTGESIVGYLLASDAQLKKTVSEHMDRAAAALGVDPSVFLPDPADFRGDPPGAKPASPANGTRVGSGRPTAPPVTNAPAGRRKESVR